MPRILTVDDSRSIRMIVSKALGELGFEMGEADDGNAGLKKLQEGSYDLVVLDVTMPNLDGPGMLAKMRESGDKTPVVMLTSESKTSIIAALMKLGIQDYVLKPFKGDELKIKVLKALKLPADYASAGRAAPASAADACPSLPAATPSASRILVIDDMENVHKKVRSLVPAELMVDASLNASDGMGLCRANKYGLILVDGELPDSNLPSLTKQLRLLQPKAVLVALTLRSANNIAVEMHAQGFDDVLFKPFANEAVAALLGRCFVENQQLVSIQENLVQLAGFHGRDDKLEHYFVELAAKMKEVLTKLAEACFDSAVLDASFLPLSQPLRAGQFVAEVCKTFAETGVVLRLVGSSELATLVGRFEEAKGVRLFHSLEEARAAA